MHSSFDAAAAEFDDRIKKKDIDPDSFFSAEPIFQQIIDQRLYVDRMNAVLRSVFDRATRTNALLTAGTFMTLHSSEYSTWVIMEHKRKSQFLYMTPVHSFQSPISGSGYAIDRYSLIGETLTNQISSNTKVELAQREQVKTNSVFKKSAVGEIVDTIVEDLEVRSLSLRVSSKPLSDFQINFDRENLSVFGITPVNPMLSNLTTIFDLLADVADAPSADYLEPFINHEQHFIRWHAMKSIYAIDKEAGLKLIDRARDDPHDHVRAAALETLSRVSA
ncbi:HEAT repeat domain-containing protein [Sphingomonas sp.]|uniref:HEAT repeat domain-containing protein n=1 Tax=Sphingomonas sp. TaxID=28214 RepID=UPI003D6CB532